MHAMRLTHPWHTTQEKEEGTVVYMVSIRTCIATEQAIINHPLIMARDHHVPSQDKIRERAIAYWPLLTAKGCDFWLRGKPTSGKVENTFLYFFLLFLLFFYFFTFLQKSKKK